MGGKLKARRSTTPHARAVVIASVAAGLVAFGPSSVADASSVAPHRPRVSVSPQSGTPDASPTTQISLLGVPARRLGAITVSGSSSGVHSGQLRPYSTGRGASFVPDKPFLAGERVHVHLRARRGRVARADVSFTIARPGPILLRGPVAGELPPPPRIPPSPQAFVSRPDLKAPPLTVRTSGPGVASGDLMLAPFAVPAPGGPPPAVGHGPAIYDPRGNLVWFDPVPGRQQVLNFHRQTLNGAPVLTWWQGTALVPFPGIGFGQDVILDSSYRELGRVRAGNGYQADLHDFTITGPSAWIPIFSPVLADLSSVGGAKQAPVLDSIVQEVDLKTGLVMFEWHSLGHIRLADSYIEPQRNVIYDATHVNSVQPLGGNTVLISLRNNRALYLVSARTGRILWTLGGSRSSFRMAKGAGFAWQHDAQYHSNGTISLFDDEAAPPVKPPSRGLVLRLNVRSQPPTAKMVQQFVHRPPVITGSQGNMQALPNGDQLVGWGAQPFVSEYDRRGRQVFDARFPDGVESYRAFRQPWTGRPLDAPAVALRPSGAGRETAFASWNGATEVESWQLLAGPDAAHLGVVASGSRSGFETALPGPAAGAYAVRALNGAGQVLGTSRAIAP